MMETSTQLKDHIRNLSNKTGVAPLILQRNYMMERLLKRISLSKYKTHFVLKGGLLIAYMIGFEARGTMDLDGTIRDYLVTEETLRDMLNDVIAIDAQDSVSLN